MASADGWRQIPADRTVVQVLEQHGVDIPVSCEQGVCGTCITRVLSGTPDHRDVYFTEEEHALNDQFTPCCSRSKTGLLVLDL
jgi:vanillate O-demethylase ferredoxin subunit